MKFVLLTVFFGLGSSLSVENCSQNPKKEVYQQTFGNSCFEFVIYSHKEYDEAEEVCKNMGGTLALPKTKEINAFLAMHLKYTYKLKKDAWIGLNDQDDEGTFFWEDRSSPSWTNFADGNGPKGSWLRRTFEDCVAIRPGSGSWHDYHCENEFFGALNEEKPFICQFPPRFITHTTRNPANFDASITTSSVQLDTSTSSKPSEFHTSTTSTPAQFDTSTTSTPAQFDSSSTSSPTQFDTSTTSTSAQFDTSTTSTPAQFDTSTTSTPTQFDTSTASTPAQFDTSTTSTPAQFDTSTTSSEAQSSDSTTSNSGQFDASTTSTLAEVKVSTTRDITNPATTCPSISCDLDCGMSGFKKDIYRCVICACDE